MPILDLSSEQISKPTKLDLTYVETLMLWPDRPKVRQEANDAALADQFQSMTESVSPNRTDTIWRLSTEDIAFLRNARRLTDFRCQKQAEQGSFVGVVLLESIRASHHGIDEGGLEVVRIKLASHLRYNLQSDTTALWWRRFRPVAHLWAARFILVNQAQGAENKGLPFPCRRDQLSDFLGTAEAARQCAETIKSTRHSPRTILPSGEAFCVAPDIRLPEFAITFATEPTQ